MSNDIPKTGIRRERPDVIVIMTDQERAAPPYESDELTAWRRNTMTGRAWFDDHAVNFGRHYTGSLACVPSRPTIFTGQYPDVHGVTQTDGLGKLADDSRLRWLRAGEVPTLGHWFRAAGYDTHYDGKWHITHADLVDDDGNVIPTNDETVWSTRRASTRTSPPTSWSRSDSPAGSGRNRTVRRRPTVVFGAIR